MMMGKKLEIIVRDMPKDCPAFLDYNCVYGISASAGAWGFSWPVRKDEFEKQLAEAKQRIIDRGLIPVVVDRRSCCAQQKSLRVIEMGKEKKDEVVVQTMELLGPGAKEIVDAYKEAEAGLAVVVEEKKNLFKQFKDAAKRAKDAKKTLKAAKENYRELKVSLKKLEF